MQIIQLSEEQQALLDVTREVLRDESSPAQVRQLTEQEEVFSRKLWSLGAEIGWQGLEVPESSGGSGQGFYESAIVLRELGRSVAVGPFLSHNLAVSALNLVPDHAVTQAWLERLATGEAIGTVVIGDLDVAGQQRLGVSATAVGNSWHLAGRALDVPDAGSADVVIVAVQTEEGPAVVAIPDATSRLEPIWQPTHDRTRRLFDVTFDDVIIPAGDVIAVGAQAEQIIDALVDRAAVGVALDSVGGLSKALEMTVEYTSGRMQYGRVIATFQAVKHTCADMFVESEVARIAADAAALEIDSDGAAQRYWSSVAKFRCADAYAKGAGDALQMHGGIGMTWEFDLHFWLKRAKLNQSLYGRSDAHRARVTRLV